MRTLALPVVISLLAVVPLRASAQESPCKGSDDDIRLCLIGLADEAMRLGDHKAALDAYNNAYAIRPSPRLDFEIAAQGYAVGDYDATVLHAKVCRGRIVDAPRTPAMDFLFEKCSALLSKVLDETGVLDISWDCNDRLGAQIPDLVLLPLPCYGSEPTLSIDGTTLPSFRLAVSRRLRVGKHDMLVRYPDGRETHIQVDVGKEVSTPAIVLFRLPEKKPQQPAVSPTPNLPPRPGLAALGGDLDINIGLTWIAHRDGPGTKRIRSAFPFQLTVPLVRFGNKYQIRPYVQDVIEVPWGDNDKPLFLVDAYVHRVGGGIQLSRHWGRDNEKPADTNKGMDRGSARFDLGASAVQLFDRHHKDAWGYSFPDVSVGIDGFFDLGRVGLGTGIRLEASWARWQDSFAPGYWSSFYIGLTSYFSFHIPSKWEKE